MKTAREQRLEAAVQATQLIQQTKSWGRPELERWRELSRAAGNDTAPPTPEGLAQLLTAALRS